MPDTTSILLIDAAVRADSRTRQLAQYLAEKLGGTVSTVRAEDAALPTLDEKTLAWRTDCCAARDFDHDYFRFAKQFAAADTIVVAAPYWDASFPAALKKYIETVCVTGLTFRYSAEGFPVGMCRAKALYYVTTAGGRIFNDAYGFGYIRDLAQNMFGIREVHLIKAENLDVIGADTDAILRGTMADIDRIAEENR